MKLSFLGNTYETISPTDIPTLETGNVGRYRGQPVRFRSTKVASSPSHSFTYRGNPYTA